MKISARGFSPKAVALAAALGLWLTGAHRGDAAPSPVVADDGPLVTLLTPAPHATFSGVKPVEISAFYKGTANNGIVGLELYIDGVKANSKTLDAPEAKGIVSFLVDASLLTPGPHRVVVRATAADAEVRSAKGMFVYAAGSDGADTLSRPAPPVASPEDNVPAGAAPEMRLLTPSPNSHVQGTVQIQVGASDAGGKTPYVSIFIDGEFKTLVNYRPFEYVWDTSAVPNGWHTIAVTETFDGDAQAAAHLKPIRVFVNNPGGATAIRHDLQDIKPMPVRPAKAVPARKTAVARPQARRPHGEALQAAPVLASRHQKSASLPMAEEALSWDGLTLPTEQRGLSDPFLPNLRASEPATSKDGTQQAPPLSGFKSRTTKSVTAAVSPRGKQGHPAARLAKAGPLGESGLSSPFLSAPALPAAAPRSTRLALPMPRLQVHLPQLSLRAPAVRPHLALESALLRSAGQRQVLFNSVKLPLERPLAARQSVLFGPLRQIFEHGGGSLQWNARTGVVRAQSHARDIHLTIGDKHALVNAHKVTLDGAPYLNSGRTMIPVSFLSTAMDATVQYDPVTGHLRITSNH